MMNNKWNEIVHERTGVRYYTMTHSSGLPMITCPWEGYRSAYAVFAARYGSIDTGFYDGDEFVNVPAGIAHYLEHKLFESEDGDAFARFAQTGASANAYTGFDKTAYLFSCAGDISGSLDILLDFVTSPYFTQKGVDKERGIIGQEICMGLDSPGRRVLMNLLDAMYVRHPVRLDIAGSVESIEKITPELLDGCYQSFYNLENMVLVAAGNITTDTVENAADRFLTASDTPPARRAAVDEPRAVGAARVEKYMPVAAPLFYLGYKEYIVTPEHRSPAQIIAARVLVRLIAGAASALYARLMERGLINPGTFDADYFDGPGYACFLFGGESKNPDAVCDAIRREIERLRREGIPHADFIAARSAVYGRQLAEINSPNGCGEMLLGDVLAGRQPFALIDAAAELAIDDVTALLDSGLQEEQSSLSLILPQE